jgi:hypothetical protein
VKNALGNPGPRHIGSAFGNGRPTSAQSDNCRPLAPDVEVGGDLLAPIYSWFTECFDTPDPRDARVLLDELR